MLTLKNIVKDYHPESKNVVHALKNINIRFRKNEFVSILGPSGCGKTTLLNLIGGLDHYTEGDLVIKGKSTRNFKDKDWDSYRNTSVGFVFQNYNLISHLSVLNNVEMALSLSGVSSKKRKEKAKKALIDVGLSDQLFKKPGQLSGGQMQRVAIARALVNDPEILLADEPTGALDSVTSIQIMKLIKEISQDRLVIMVTHNAEIAHDYSDRIIELLDGEIIKDSNPDTNEYDGKMVTLNKTTMSFISALSSSFKNLVTKKTRTFITMVAGSIGIIGIALVLAISNGMNSYVNRVQSDTLSGFPITINQQVSADIIDNAGPPEFIVPGETSDQSFTDELIVYSNDPVASSAIHTNVFNESFLDYLDEMDSSYYNSISYTSNLELNIITKNPNDDVQMVEVEVTNGSTNPFSSTSVLYELPDNEAFILSQYEVLLGSYPKNAFEAILVLNTENELEIQTLEALGLGSQSTYTFEEIIGKTYQVVPNDAYYYEEDGRYKDTTDVNQLFDLEENITVEIVGILRAQEDATSELLSSGLAYTKSLTDVMIENAADSQIVQSQLERPNINVFTGLPFLENITLNDVLSTIGGDSSPTSIQIYPVTFETKNEIKSYIDAYNETVPNEEIIIYTDVAESVSSTLGVLIDTITYILTAFAAISLVVSSIMIGIITYVSVIERTKEIGIMRSLGARKKDISRIFNAETLLIGLSAGIFGVGLYYLLQIPLNLIIVSLIGVENFAFLDILSASLLITLSSFLTLLSGIIPSRIASKKDPVEALRTE